MTELKNDLLIRALLRKPVPRTPVWIMRQAGRYLPEYRELRKEAGDFMSLCRNPELACEVTMQPLRRFKLDAAILFSDILTVPDAMGLGLYFETGEGPKFERPVRTASDIRKLPRPDVADKLGFVFDAVSTIRGELDGEVPLIGFAGSPWTVGTYMVEGGSSREFPIIKGLAKDDPDLLDEMLAKLAAITTDYLNAQIEAGAQAIMIFDTWGGAGETLADMVTTGCDALGVDWTTDLATARGYVNDRVALQGNLDPATLRESPEVIRQGVADTLASYGTGPGHVFNLGHGITPDIDPENLGILVDAVHELSPAYHS